MAPEIPDTPSIRNQNRLSCKAYLEILSSFPRKVMNTKVGGHFMSYNQDTKFALFGVRTWEIWCRQGRTANQENLDEADFMETKFHSLPRNVPRGLKLQAPEPDFKSSWEGVRVAHGIPLGRHLSENHHQDCR
jgi:hypothetical protein